APADLVERVAADRVEGHVDAAAGGVADGVHEVRDVLVVDDHVGAQLLAEAGLGGAAGDGDDVGPGCLPELDGGGPGAAGGPGDEQPLARLQLRPLVEGEPGGPVVHGD